MKTIWTSLLALPLLAGCATNRPFASSVQGEAFSGLPLSGERPYVICNMPAEYRKRIAEPICEKLGSELTAKGANAHVEVQMLNPLALGSGVDFRGTQRHSTSAILLVRMGESSSGSLGSHWVVSFDLIDAKGKGSWRGRSSIYRISPPEEMADKVVRELFKALGEAGAITFPGEKKA